MKDKTTFIYTLSDPITNEIRYVGKSNFPKKRLYDHMKSCNRTNTHKNNWIRSLLENENKPILGIIAEVPMKEWEYWEQHWIDKLRVDNDLTNHGSGGGTTEHRYNTIEKMKQRHKDFPGYNRSGGNIKKYFDRDVLYDMYITQNLSLKKISKEMGCGKKKVFDSLKEYGIEKSRDSWKSQLSTTPIKVVLQYDLDGDLIKEWPEGPSYIKRETGIEVARCCRGLVNTSKGYIWRYKDEWFDLGLDKRPNSYIIEQYDMDGNFVTEHSSRRKAALSIGKGKNMLNGCVPGESKTVGGFIWKCK